MRLWCCHCRAIASHTPSQFVVRRRIHVQQLLSELIDPLFDLDEISGNFQLVNQRSLVDTNPSRKRPFFVANPVLTMTSSFRCRPVIWVKVKLKLAECDLKGTAIFQFRMAASALSGVVAEVKIDLF